MTTPYCQGCVTPCKKHPRTGDWICPRCGGDCEVPLTGESKTHIDQIAELLDDKDLQ